MNQFVEQPREPLRSLVDTPKAFGACLESLASGSGPVAFDAERAHGHRYWPKAYLFQIRRAGAGTWLIDPISLEQGGTAKLGGLVEACSDAPWIIHAASQDLPCMLEVGIHPPMLFDTELAGRLLGAPSVGLAALLEAKLGIRLRKAHSADNWATRPLPTSWLIYAALDVDYLIELADVLRAELVAKSRTAWAEEEFAHVLEVFSNPPAPRKEPWRRMSGVQGLKHPKQLAVARALWQERDSVARRRDRPPSRILTDAAIVEFASGVDPEGPLPDTPAFSRVPGFNTRVAIRHRGNWACAVESVSQLPTSEYPSRRPEPNGMPQPRSWERNNPDCWELWKKIRADVDALAGELGIQPSLIAPSSVLQAFIHNWEDGRDPRTVLLDVGSRNWQADLLVPLLAEKLCN
jgi:ribonuclease D (3-5 exonuclease)